jgi:ABC-type amino acid transport substrate-binding protein
MRRKPITALALAGVTAVGLLTGCASSPASGNGGGESTSATSDYELVKDGVLQVLVIGDAAPFASINDDDEFEGFDVALLTEVTERLDLDIEFRTQDFDTILPSVAIGQADAAASSIADTAERRQTVTFSLPTYIGVMGLTVPEDSDIEDAESLAGKRVGVISASRNAEYAEQYWTDSELIYFPSESALFNALQGGTVDAAFFDGQVADKYVKEYDVRVAFTAVNDDNIGAAIVLNQDSNNLREDINATLREILEDGTYEDLFTEWVTTESVQPQIDFLSGYYEEHPEDSYPAE